jgi:hypothetical protein
MPPKKGKKGGKKGKKKGKKKVMKGPMEIPEIILKRLLKHYENQCKASECAISPYMKKLMKDCIEKNLLLVKVCVYSKPHYFSYRNRLSINSPGNLSAGNPFVK